MQIRGSGFGRERWVGGREGCQGGVNRELKLL